MFTSSYMSMVNNKIKIISITSEGLEEFFPLKGVLLLKFEKHCNDHNAILPASVWLKKKAKGVRGKTFPTGPQFDQIQVRIFHR